MQVAEARSFIAAGRLLGMSASAVGKSIARLEEKLGAQLFHRSTRSITLTAEGMLLRERGQRILAELEAAQLDLSQAKELPRGRLRVSLPWVSSALVLPVLANFMRHYPEVVLDLDFTDRMVDVIEEGFDTVVRIGEPADSRLSARCLGTYKTCLVASPDYLERHGIPQHPADLAQHICLQYRYAHSGKLQAWPLRRLPSEPDWSLPTSMICNNLETRLSFAQTGVGIACVPEFAARDALADGTLRTVLDGYVERVTTLRILWPASRYPLPRLRVFIDFLSERVAARLTATLTE